MSKNAPTSTSSTKTKLLNIRIEPELKDRARALAEADGRSLSNWVLKLISRQIREAEEDSHSGTQS